MWIDAAGTANGTVAPDASISAGMTGLAGIETTPGLPGMVLAPDMHARCDPAVEVAVVATTQGSLAPVIGVDRFDVAVDSQVKDPPVGGAGRPTVPHGVAAETVVAGLAGGRFVAS